MTSVLMTTRLPCVICGNKHRTNNRRIAANKWAVLCVSCQTALAQLKSWQVANPKLDVAALMRVFGQMVPKPAAAVKAAPREKTA